MDKSVMATRLRDCRKSKGLTIEEAAKAIGIKAVTLNSYELGYKIPKDLSKKQIAEFYNQSIEYLFFGS